METLPLFPLQTVLFPTMALPLHIFEERYRRMMRERIESDPIFGVVQTRTGREVGEQPEIYTVGTAASLLKAVRYDDGRYDLVVRGGRRFRVVDGTWASGYLTGMVEWIDAEAPAAMRESDAGQLVADVQQAFHDYLDAVEEATGARIDREELTREPMPAYAICSMMPFDLGRRQRLLEIEDSGTLLRELLRALRQERQLVQLSGIGGALIQRPAARFSVN